MGTKPNTRVRLPFVLPEFCRHSWVSERARSVWEPRIARIARAWLEVEWLSVAAGIRACGLLWISPDILSSLIPKWEKANLSATQLNIDDAHFGRHAAAGPASVAGMICVVVGGLDKIEELRRAWTAADDEVIGTLLGYPPCCRAFYRHVWVEQGCFDTTWAMTENASLEAVNGIVRIELQEKLPPLANILWRWVGVRAVPHLPCRFDCSSSIAFGRDLLEVADKAGYDEEAEWITEILSWPVEWSGLHGIAEIKSPLLKTSTRTDATREKCIVQWVSTRYPEEGGIGLHFPYQGPKKPTLTVLREHQHGLGHAPLETEGPPAWLHADNGFASAEAMRLLHQPIVTLARTAVATESGSVLDLGCGNGTLLAKVCDGRGDLVPHGIDSNGLAVEHARRQFPQFARNFLHGDLFEVELWANGGRKYVLALLMLGRLLEVPRDQAIRLLKHLQVSCSRVLAYVYPDWGEESLETIAKQLGLQLEKSSCGTAAYLGGRD